MTATGACRCARDGRTHCAADAAATVRGGRSRAPEPRGNPLEAGTRGKYGGADRSPESGGPGRLRRSH